MRSYRATFVLVAIMALLAVPVAALGENEPVNPCIMLPEVLGGRGASDKVDPRTYRPESCIVSGEQADRLDRITTAPGGFPG